MNILLIVLAVLLIVSVINTFLIVLIDHNVLDENRVLIITGGIFTWLILLIKVIISLIKGER